MTVSTPSVTTGSKPAVQTKAAAVTTFDRMQPTRAGLYDPRNEHDACGVGFIAQMKNVKSHQIVREWREYERSSTTVLSASPELFFRLDGERLTAKPMKGTAARGRTPRSLSAYCGTPLGNAAESWRSGARRRRGGYPGAADRRGP